MGSAQTQWPRELDIIGSFIHWPYTKSKLHWYLAFWDAPDLSPFWSLDFLYTAFPEWWQLFILISCWYFPNLMVDLPGDQHDQHYIHLQGTTLNNLRQLFKGGGFNSYLFHSQKNHPPDLCGKNHRRLWSLITSSICPRMQGMPSGWSNEVLEFDQRCFDKKMADVDTFAQLITDKTGVSYI